MSARRTAAAVGGGAERLRREVDVGRAGERVGDDEGRRGEVVRLHVRVHAALEVAVAGEHGGGHELAVVHRLRHLGRQRAAVADAGRAAVADDVEAEGLEVGQQARLAQVLGHDLRARGEARLDVGRDAQAAADGLPGEEARAQHHRGVRRVGAARDRGDHDRAVPELGLLPAHLDGHRLPGVLRGEAEAALLHRRGEGLAEGLLHRARAPRGPAAASGRRGSARPSRGRAPACR